MGVPTQPYPYPGSPSPVAAVSPEAVPTGAVGEISAAAVEGYAQATITLSGTPASADTVSAVIDGKTTTYTLTGTDTLATAATALAGDINANSAVNALVDATAAGDVVTVKALLEGVIGMYSFSASATGITATASGTELDFLGNVVVPNQSFSFNTPNGVESFYTGIPRVVDAATKSLLKNSGLVR